MDQHLTTNKKSASTDDKYQSTFMPIFADAEARIKRLIVFAFFVGMSKTMLTYQIQQIIISVKNKIPNDLHDRSAYINGLIKSANRLIHRKEMETLKFQSFIKKNDLKGKVKNPQEYQEFIKTIEPDARGAVQIEWYNKEINRYVNEVGEIQITTAEAGKKPISLWQKAELDVRYQKNMQMLQDQIDNGVQYAFLSSHADCSKRCEPWQGKLVSLTEHATMSGFRVKKLDGMWVYSLPDIMAQTDKYGYHNNIISGFNCRHHTIPYDPGSNQKPPREYSKEDVKKQREIESNIRASERHIRSLKMKLNEYNSISGRIAERKARILNRKIKHAVASYKKYCNDNGYAWYKYRIDVNDNNIYLVKKEK